MYLNRRVFVIKPECFNEAIRLFTEQKEGDDKVYVSVFGRFHQIAIEIEFRDLEEYQKEWDEWLAKPESQKFNTKLRTFLASGSTNELWELV